MLPTISCSACGTVLGVPKGGMPKDGLPCNWCGYVNPPATDAGPRAQPAPQTAVTATSVTAETPPSIEKPAPHRWADDVDDNGQPYALPPDEVKTRRCESCTKEIDLVAVVCVHCGFDAGTKKKVERVFVPIDRSWESGWPFQRRLTVFLLAQGANLLTLIVATAAGESLPLSIGAILFYVGLQAFLLGTFESVRIRRNKKGQVEITSLWRIAFVPKAAKKVNWREREGVAFGHYDDTGISDWIIFVQLLFMCVVPALLWWWFVMRSDHFYAALTRDRGYPETYLYKGMNEAQAKEICQVATDATGLPLTTPL
jgi:hypothetical protein